MAEVFTPSFFKQGSTKRQMTPSDSSPEGPNLGPSSEKSKTEVSNNLTKRQRKRRRTNARIAEYKRSTQNEDEVGNEEDGLPSVAARLSWTEEEEVKKKEKEKNETEAKRNAGKNEKVRDVNNESSTRKKKRTPLGLDQQDALYKMKWLISDPNSGVTNDALDK